MPCEEHSISKNALEDVALSVWNGMKTNFTSTPYIFEN